VSHLSVQTKLETVSSNSHYYVKIEVQLLGFLSMNKGIRFLQFLNKGSILLFLIYFSSALLISLKYPFSCVLKFIFCFCNYLLLHYSG
jgi:hypothetical protein